MTSVPCCHSVLLFLCAVFVVTRAWMTHGRLSQREKRLWYSFIIWYAPLRVISRQFKIHRRTAGRYIERVRDAICRDFVPLHYGFGKKHFVLCDDGVVRQFTQELVFGELSSCMSSKISEKFWNDVKITAVGDGTYIYCQHFGGFAGNKELFSGHKSRTLQKVMCFVTSGLFPPPWRGGNFFKEGESPPWLRPKPGEFPPLKTSSGGGIFSHFSPETAQYGYILVNLVSKKPQIPQNFLARAFRALACFSSCSLVMGLRPKSHEIRTQHIFNTQNLKFSLLPRLAVSWAKLNEEADFSRDLAANLDVRKRCSGRNCSHFSPEKAI